MVRSTVTLERPHREDRRGIRHRTGQSATGPEMGRQGALLAFWSNARCRRFVEVGLREANLWTAFARRDPKEVARRLRGMPAGGRRPMVVVAARQRQERLEALVRLLSGSTPLEPGLSAWAATVGLAMPAQETPGL
ncbi:MAG: hypothetical protein ACYDFT_03670 [Thermoplasmata archaeon]